MKIMLLEGTVKIIFNFSLALLGQNVNVGIEAKFIGGKLLRKTSMAHYDHPRIKFVYPIGWALIYIDVV